MESLYLLIPLALVIIVLAIKLLFWAINNGQYDDLDTESQRILFDEPLSKVMNKKNTKVVSSDRQSSSRAKGDSS